MTGLARPWWRRRKLALRWTAAVGPSCTAASDTDLVLRHVGRQPDHAVLLEPTREHAARARAVTEGVRHGAVLVVCWRSGGEAWVVGRGGEESDDQQVLVLL